jgi:hypothetical protein
LETISGGSEGFLASAEPGMWMLRSGFAKRASTWDAWAVRGVRARFLVGRCERGSAEVGIDSGMGSDIVVVELMSRVDGVARTNLDRRRLLSV